MSKREQEAEERITELEKKNKVSTCKCKCMYYLKMFNLFFNFIFRSWKSRQLLRST